MMLKITMLGLALAAFTLSVVVPAASAETILSPLVQVRDGVPAGEVICSDGHVLMTSPSGNPACVFVSSTDALETRGFVHASNITTGNPAASSKSAPQTGSAVDKHSTWSVNDENSPHWILETIPNPTGYWVPIVDRDEFASRIADAVGDTVLDATGGVVKTEQGKIVMRGHVVESVLADFSEVEYTLKTGIERGDDAAEKEFVKHFMDEMGFEYDRDAFEQYEPRNVYLDDRTYHFHEEYGSIGFFFADYHAEQVPLGLTERIPGSAELLAAEIPDFDILGYVQLQIIFGGWTNNPDLVTPTLNPEAALEAARKYASTNPELNTPAENGGNCEYVLGNLGGKVRLHVDFGIPTYWTEPGWCTSDDTGHNRQPIIIVDGWTGEYSYVIYRSHLD